MPAMATTCTVDGCHRVPQARAGGLCAAHYKRQQRGQSLDAPLRDRDRPTISTRVARETKLELEHAARERGVPLYRVAADILDGWAGVKKKK